VYKSSYKTAVVLLTPISTSPWRWRE